MRRGCQGHGMRNGACTACSVRQAGLRPGLAAMLAGRLACANEGASCEELKPCGRSASSGSAWLDLYPDAWGQDGGTLVRREGGENRAAAPFTSQQARVRVRMPLEWPPAARAPSVACTAHRRSAAGSRRAAASANMLRCPLTQQRLAAASPSTSTAPCLVSARPALRCQPHLCSSRQHAVLTSAVQGGQHALAF